MQAEQVFSDCGIKVLHLPADSEGIRMDALKSCGAKLLFISPSNRVQTGTSLPMAPVLGPHFRGVAQLGRALRSGRRGR